ncbi:Mediator of RNA polymerase II transcription subunit 11 [Bulinus truncatus]|nr:Mediator of RNA polymerase II transcription subunit 11 [Bulinus truncatus]
MTTSLHSSLMVGAPREKLQALEKIEKDIATALQTAGQALQELSKDKPALKHVETHSSNFLKTLQEIENGLSQQISYLSQVTTGQPHEGSSYASQKDHQMSLHRLEHVKSRLGELDKIKQEHLRQKHSGSYRSYTLPDQIHQPHTPQQQQVLTPQPQQKQRDQQREQQAQL